MTGCELIKWILDNHAEDAEVIYLQEDGIVTPIFSPEVLENADVKAEYYEALYLPDEGRCVIL